MGIFNSLTDLAVIQTLNLSRVQELYITNNLANYDTPGYKAQQFSFQSQLQAALSQGPTAVMQVTGSVTPIAGAIFNNGNSVDLTAQMAELAKAQLLYQTAVQAFNAKVTAYKIVTEEKPQ